MLMFYVECVEKMFVHATRVQRASDSVFLPGLPGASPPPSSLPRRPSLPHLTCSPPVRQGSRTDSLRDFHLNPANTVNRTAGDSSATLVSSPPDNGALPAAGGGGGGSDTEQSEMSSLLSVPTTPSGRHVNFVEVRQRSASHPTEAPPAANGDADEPNSAAV